MNQTWANRRTQPILALRLFIVVLLAVMKYIESPGYAQARNKQMSDREKAGLRGPVKTCTERSRFGGITAGDGTFIPEQTYSNTTEYDIAGNIIDADDSQSSTRITYDAQGRIIKKTLKTSKETILESVYSYDEQGRLLKITDGNRPDNSVTFRYDEHGRKTAVQMFSAADYRPNGAVAGSPFEAASMPNLPGGGSSTTLYDEHDRPTEIQSRDAQGQLVERAVRTYDKDGRVLEEHQTVENVDSMITPEMKAEALKAGASIKDLHDAFAKFLGEPSNLHSVVYSYDGQGRLTKTHRRIFNEDEVVETLYNEHGDKAAEITRSKRTDDANDQNSGPPPYSEVRYSYQYDEHGNWTEETVSQRSSPDGVFESSPGRQRTFTYY
jgi:YD repeat-containing protein